MSTDRTTSNSADLAYAALYSGFVGSGAIAVFFLFRDLALGNPLLTPSAFGTALFAGGADLSVVRLEMVALASVVHVALFTAVGTAFAVLLDRFEELHSSPIILGIGIFAVLSAGIGLLDIVTGSGLLGALGPVTVTIGNAFTATAMTVFYRGAFVPEPVALRARSSR